MFLTLSAWGGRLSVGPNAMRHTAYSSPSTERDTTKPMPTGRAVPAAQALCVLSTLVRPSRARPHASYCAPSSRDLNRLIPPSSNAK
jgi:hypothetical protein